MRTFAAGTLRRGPRRSQPGRAFRPYLRGQLRAGISTIVVIAELLIVPIAVPVSLVLLAVGRVSRWRQEWLLLPLLLGTGWLVASGPRRAANTAESEPGRLLSALAHAAADPSRLPHDPGGSAATVVAWLPRELPAALVAGAVQAGLLMWLGSRRRREIVRPGLMAAVRRRRSRALLSAGRTVTGAGFTIGLDARTGRLAGLGWGEAGRGVLLTGTDPDELTPVALAVACAAMRRRKTVLALDFDSADATALTEAIAPLAGTLGVAATRVPQTDGALRTAAGRAIRARGVVLASGPGEQLAAELTGLLAWLRDRGLRGDSLLCLGGCEAVDPALLVGLLALGPATGTTMLITTTSIACAEALAGHVGQLVACGPISEQLAARLIAALGSANGGPGQDAGALARQLTGEIAVLGTRRLAADAPAMAGSR